MYVVDYLQRNNKIRKLVVAVSRGKKYGLDNQIGGSTQHTALGESRGGGVVRYVM